MSLFVVCLCVCVCVFFVSISSNKGIFQTETAVVLLLFDSVIFNVLDVFGLKLTGIIHIKLVI